MKRESKKRIFRLWVIPLTVFIVIYTMIIVCKYTSIETYNALRHTLNPQERVFDEIISEKINVPILCLTSDDFNKIEELCVIDKNLTNLNYLKSLKNLETLIIKANNINEEQIIELQKALPDLTIYE